MVHFDTTYMLTWLFVQKYKMSGDTDSSGEDWLQVKGSQLDGDETR